MDQQSIDIKAYNIGIKKCSFNDICEFCDSPQLSTFCRCSCDEDNDDGYYICGKCFRSIVLTFPMLNDFEIGIHMDKLKEQQEDRLPF